MHNGATPSQSLVPACPVYPGRFGERENGLGGYDEAVLSWLRENAAITDPAGKRGGQLTP